MEQFIYSNPSILKILPKFMAFWDKLKLFLTQPTVAIHGSNYTTNVGDRIISLIIKNELHKRNISSTIISRFSNAPNTNKVIVAGGGILHNNYPNNLSLRTSFLQEKKDVFYVGIGCPGFSKLTEKETMQLSKLDSSTYISVRDKKSLENLVLNSKTLEKKILLRACPSWLIFENPGISDFSTRNHLFRTYYNFRFGNYSMFNNTLTSKPKIGLVINGYFDLTYLTSIINKIKHLQLTNDITFIPFVGEDLEFYNMKIKQLGIKCLSLKNPISTYESVLKMDKMIATRYHSLIFSLLAHKPVLILGYEQKVIDLAEDLNLEYFDLLDSGKKSLIFNHYDQNIIDDKVNLARKQLYEIVKLMTSKIELSANHSTTTKQH